MLSLSAIGLSLGLLFFAASLMPSLIPRTVVVQGVLGGLMIATGYLIATTLIWIIRSLEIPPPSSGVQLALNLMALATGGGALILLLVFNLDYQNDLRALMTMEPLEDSHSATMVGIAAALFLGLLVVARLIKWATAAFRARLLKWFPRRLAVTVSLVLVALLSWNIANGLILRGALATADRGLQELDAFIDPDLPTPTNALRSGGEASLVSWRTLGARGRQFAAGGLSEADISEFHGGAPAMTPIRIYAGLNSAEDVEARADLVLQEMLRTGAFERDILIVASPTGTGWIDPEAVDPLEVMHRGDTAIVGMQYSYLSSPLSLIFEPDRAPESARALAQLVHDHWAQMPPEARPRLYLHGLSLGSYSSEQALTPLRAISDPIDGALWSGPTFNNFIWKSMTRDRNPDSPYWSPRIEGGDVVRFTTQKNTLDDAERPWARTRAIYLQYPSDAITFFEPESAFRPPEWMNGPRAPDVSKDLTWYPIITMFQLAMDMATATNVPKGFGHLYAAEHYIDAWEALTDPEGWTEADGERLKEMFGGR